MTQLDVDGAIFTFPNHWSATKYDEWLFYQKAFQATCGGGIKAVDILAIDQTNTGWIVEVKDFRADPRSGDKPSDLPNEVAKKVFDTLAGLLPTKILGEEPNEVAFARSMLGVEKLRIVLHLDQPRVFRPLYPRGMNAANIQQELRRLLRAVDDKAIVYGASDSWRVEWRVVPRQ